MKSLLDPTLPFASEGASNRLEPELQSAYQAWKENDAPDTRASLLKHVKPITDRALSMYGATGNPYATGQAKALALSAFRTYDPSRASLRTHLLSNLQRLQRVTAQSDQAIGIPERLALSRQHVAEATSRLRDDLGRDPDDLELAAHTGLSLQQLQKLRKLSTGTNTGSMLDQEGDVFSPASTIPGQQPAADMWAQMVYYDLGSTDRQILAHSLGMHGHAPKSTNELASMLGVTPGAVSQRKAKIQALLDQQYDVNLFGGH